MVGVQDNDFGILFCTFLFERENRLSQVAGWGKLFFLSSGFNSREKFFPKPKQFMPFCIAKLFLSPSMLFLLYPRPVFLLFLQYWVPVQKNRPDPVWLTIFFCISDKIQAPAVTQSRNLGYIPFLGTSFSQIWVSLLWKRGQLPILILSSKDNNRAKTREGEKQVKS